jgi:hypothetical protein
VHPAQDGVVCIRHSLVSGENDTRPLINLNIRRIGNVPTPILGGRIEKGVPYRRVG